jgi:TctA family transporter
MGIISGLIGLLIAMIELDPMDGTHRFTFEIDFLLVGIS